MERLFWICLAGAAGTGTRYLVARWAAQRLGSTFPYGTLIVNLAGCFCCADACRIDFRMVSERARGAHDWPCGRPETSSSFNYETIRLFEEGAPATAVMNLGLTLFGCFLAGWLGLAAAREVLGR